jgi:hypothetical protein
VDPARPVIRLQPSIPRLHFYLSPGRMSRLLRVVRAALPQGDSAQDGGGVGGAAGGGAVQEAWRQHAEHEGEVRVLTWGGIGRTSVVWCPRHAIVYQVGRGGVGWGGWVGATQSPVPSLLLPDLLPCIQLACCQSCV